ncbi:peptidase M16 [Bacteroidota bacterium]|nr:peptidase M16 [Bacteroidota bacterium]
MKKYFKQLALFILHFLFFTIATAQTFPDVQQFQLANKLKVYVIPYGDISATEVTLFVNCGQKNEIPGQQSYSEIVANCLALGSEKYDRTQLQDELFKLGTGISATANENYTTVSARFLNENLDKGLDIFSSVIMKPLFPDEELKQYISRTVDFNNLNKMDIGALASVFSNLSVYGINNPLGRYFYKDQLIKITPAILKDFYSFNYTPGNSRLVICGKTDLASAKLLAEKYFGSWTAPYGEVNGVSYSVDPIKKIEIGFINRSGATQASLQWNKIGPQPLTKDADIFRIANYVFNQVLFKEIREKGGKTYGIRSSYDPGSSSSIFSITTQVRSVEVENTMVLFDQVLKNFYDIGINQLQLKKAKQSMEKSVTGIDNPTSWIQFFNPVVYSNPDSRKNLVRMINLISLDEVNKIIKKYYTPDSYKLIIAGQEEVISPLIPQWNTIKKYTVADISTM